MLNACQSGKQVGDSETSLGSRLMQAGVQLVLAMGYSVTVSAAELLMSTLYGKLFAGHDLAAAIRRARLELYNRKSGAPISTRPSTSKTGCCRSSIRISPALSVRDLTAEEANAYYSRQAESYHSAAKPSYGFIGRDLDILEIEKRLLSRRNILLVRGMGGAGKTTLLQHLGEWWQTTHFVDRVFSFGYDQKAWTRQQIMVDIAQKLYSKVEYYGQFEPLGLEAQQAKLAGSLRADAIC